MLVEQNIVKIISGIVEERLHDNENEIEKKKGLE